MQTSQTRIPGFILQNCNSRYILRQVNYSLFLYDKQDDIYIPVEVVEQTSYPVRKRLRSGDPAHKDNLRRTE